MKPVFDSPDPRVLIVRLSALGDILHALPALAALRRERPEAFIGWLVEDRGADIVEGHPLLDAVHVLPRRAVKAHPLRAATGPLRRLAAELRAQRYDAAIDFQGLTKSALWTRLCGAPMRVGFAGEDAREASRLFYNFAVRPRAEKVHVVQRNLELLRPLGIENAAVDFPLRFSEAARSSGAAVWGETDDGPPRIVLNPGAGWSTKQWPAANYGRLAARLAREAGGRVALAWGPGEESLVREALAAAGCDTPSDEALRLTERVGDKPGVYALPPTSFVELGAATERAALFVGGDTGPTHFAAALGVPTISLFGASDAARNAPLGKRVETIQLDDPPCIPCWKTKCEWREPLACLRGISVDRVFELCSRLLKQGCTG